MTPAMFDLMRTAARTLLAHRDAGRHCDPYSVAWAEALLRSNPETKPLEPDMPRKIVPMSKWAQAVHTHCLSSGTGITPLEAIAQFGNPTSSSPAHRILANAERSGYFRCEEWQEETGSGLVRKFRYWALESEHLPRPTKVPVHSYFDGLKRVRSVFELGASL